MTDPVAWQRSVAARLTRTAWLGTGDADAARDYARRALAAGARLRRFTPRRAQAAAERELLALCRARPPALVEDEPAVAPSPRFADDAAADAWERLAERSPDERVDAVLTAAPDSPLGRALEAAGAVAPAPPAPVPVRGRGRELVLAGGAAVLAVAALAVAVGSTDAQPRTLTRARDTTPPSPSSPPAWVTGVPTTERTAVDKKGRIIVHSREATYVITLVCPDAQEFRSTTVIRSTCRSMVHRRSPRTAAPGNGLPTATAR
jgi:hypothetical protein